VYIKMPNVELYKKCLVYLDTVSEIFRTQHREADFQSYYNRIVEIGSGGKGRPLIDLIIELNEYIDSKNLEYLGPLTRHQKILFDIYMDICTGTRKVEDIRGLTPEELNCLKTAQTIRTEAPTPDLIELAADVELEMFRIIKAKS
jgi:hypothetical protein